MACVPSVSLIAVSARPDRSARPPPGTRRVASERGEYETGSVDHLPRHLNKTVFVRTQKIPRHRSEAATFCHVRAEAAGSRQQAVEPNC